VRCDEVAGEGDHVFAQPADHREPVPWPTWRPDQRGMPFAEDDVMVLAAGSFLRVPFGEVLE